MQMFFFPTNYIFELYNEWLYGENCGSIIKRTIQESRVTFTMSSCNYFNNTCPLNIFVGFPFNIATFPFTKTNCIPSANW